MTERTIRIPGICDWRDSMAAERWMSGIAREWSDELSDDRQDIYTLDDGEPVDNRPHELI